MTRRHRLIAFFSRGAAFGMGAMIVAAIAGQLVRDRSVPLAVLMYFPLVLIGPAAIVVDLLSKGRALPRSRFALTVVGVAGTATAAIPMIAFGPATANLADEKDVSLLHWNVQWGGGFFRSPSTWARQRSEIMRHGPDIVILSELPPADWLERLVADLGPGASFVGIQHDARSTYWFRMAVCSRWPIKLEDRRPVPGGVAMSATALVRGKPIRLLIVDGRSNPFRSRLPFLRAIADICHAAAQAGQPYDAVAGDFNTPSRSIGFDALAAQGYELASRSAAGWRGTFPSWLPVYDIDHVWFGPGLFVRSCALFTGPSTDHRGQVVHLVRREGKAFTRVAEIDAMAAEADRLNYVGNPRAQR